MIIAEDRPITAAQFSPEAVRDLPLRKPPTVEGVVRVVEIAGIDWSACGGTHVRSTAAIGSIIITKTERRGSDTRVYFACGGRAHDDHRRRASVTQTLMSALTTGLEELPAAVSRLREDLSSERKALRTAETQLITMRAEQLLAAAPITAGVHFVQHVANGADAGVLRPLAASILAAGMSVTLLAWSGEKPRWLIGRSPDVEFDVRQLLPDLRAIAGVQGGGSAELIQGSAPDADTLQYLLQIASQTLYHHLAP